MNDLSGVLSKIPGVYAIRSGRSNKYSTPSVNSHAVSAARCASEPDIARKWVYRNDRDHVFRAPPATQRKVERAHLHNPTAIFKRRWTICMNWRDRQMAIGQLSAMSDRGLKDIGLTRSELERAVEGGMPRSGRRSPEPHNSHRFITENKSERQK
jgi:uncharacterized protein YjiS (DUF1127 family)